MEATFCLGRQPLIASPLLLTSNLSNLPVINGNVGIRYSSLSLMSGYMSSSYTHLIRPVTCTLDRFPKPRRNNNGDDDIKPKSMVGAAAVLTCVLGIISCSSSKYKAMAQPLIPPSAPQAKDITNEGPPSLDGRHALESLLEVFHNSMSREAQNDIGLSMQCQVKLGPNRTSMELFRNTSSEVGTKQDFGTIQRQAFSMLKCGMVNEAVEMVKQKYDIAEKEDDPDMAYLLDMLLVEILICEGKYEEALSRKCLKDEPVIPSDSRHSLYKAILYTMSNNEEEATKCWDAFKSSLEGGFQPGT